MNRAVAVMVVGLIAATVGVGWSYVYLANKQEAAGYAADELADCVRLASRIRTIEQQPQRAQSHEILHADLTQRIEEALGTAKIEAKRLTTIDPFPPRRIGDGPYLEKGTRFRLDRITLTQLVNALHTLSSDNRGLWVKDMRLQFPPEQQVGDRWLAEVTVAYLIYSPLDGGR